MDTGVRADLMAQAFALTAGTLSALASTEHYAKSGTIDIVERTITEESSEDCAQLAYSIGPELPRAKKRYDPPLSLPFIYYSNSGARLLCNKDIGRGGQSRCYRLRAGDGQYYAMKAIATASLTTPAIRRRLALEIKIHSELKHPGIVTFLESRCIDTHWLLVLEFCPNGTLSDWLKRHGPFAEINTCRILLPIFDAIKYLHDRLIFHGDIKLSNILLDASMRPRLCDFGFAKQLASVHQRCHSPYGTPSYMAREIVISPQSFGLEADIWSLGVVMYALLYGVTPFDAKTTDEVYRRIASHDLRFPAIEPPVSTAAQTFIRRMLDMDPYCRPTSKELRFEEWPEQCLAAVKPKPPMLSPSKGVRSMLEKLQASKEPAKMIMMRMLCGKAH